MPALKVYLQQIFAKLAKSSFIKNVLVVMSGTAVAQALGFALSPIISRLFSPSDFGIFGSFGSIFGIIASVTTLEFATTIVLPKEKKDAINLFFISCLATSVIALLSLVACLLAPTFVMNLMKAPNTWILVMLVLATLVTGFNQACQSWCVRAKAFKHTSASQVIRSLSSNGMQIGLGYARGGAVALIYATVLAELLATLNLCRVVMSDLKTLRHEIKWVRIKQLVREYRDFPMYSATMELMNALSQGLPVLLLTHFYGIAVAGSFAFGSRILSAPMQLVTRAFKQVFYQKASETDHHGGRLLPLYIKSTFGLFALALLPSVVMFIWAPQICTWIFGSQWHTAGEFARWLVLWLIFMFCNGPSGIMFRILRLQRMMFFFDFSLLAARALVLVLGGIYLSAHSTVMMFAVVGAIMNLIFISIIAFTLRRKEGSIAYRDI